MSEESKVFQEETARNQPAGGIKNNTERNEMSSQWTEQSSPSIPMRVFSSVPNRVFNGGGSSYSQQQFLPTNNTINSFSIPNNDGSHFGNGFPSTSNGVHNGYSGWVVPTPNSRRFLTCPQTNLTTKSSTSGVRKQKRIRTAFTAMQMVVLEQEYKKNNFLDRVRRTSLAEMLGLNERVIKIWFQNRRMKDKKVKPDTNNLEEEASSTTGIPFVIQNEQTDEMVDRNIYLDQYLTAPTSTLPIPTQQIPILGQVDQLPMVNSFHPHYIPEEYDPYQQRVHLQIQHYGPSAAYSNRFQEIVNDSPPSQEEAASPPDAVNNIIGDPNLDISWVNNINIDEDC